MKHYIFDFVILYDHDVYVPLCVRLCQSELEHTAALSGAVAAMRTDEEQRLKTQVEKMRGEEEVK